MAVLVVGGLLVAGAVAPVVRSGYQLRAAELACREFRRADARRLLDSAYPFRSWWDPDAQFLAARLARLGKSPGEAEGHLRACQRLEGVSPRVQLEWVLLRASRGEIDEVEPGLWQAVLSGDPDSPFILEVVVGMKLQGLQFVQAGKALDKWLEIDPDNAQALEWRGWALWRLQRHDPAEQSFLRCLEVDPARVQARVWLLEVYLDRFKLAEAGPVAARLAAEAADRADALSAVAQFRFLAGHPAAARELFDRAFEKGPRDHDVLIRRGKLELETGHPAEAERWLRRALAVEELDTETNYLLHQAISQQPDRAREAADQLARYQACKEESERFDRLLRELIPKNPTNPGYAAELGDILFRVNQPDRGVYWHYAALKIDPDYAPSHRALADHFARTGRADEAARHRAHLPPATAAR